ncbi:hypothetical protein KAR10_05555 [bacterium]|nr:hypothetical protein [bacterium]
MKIFNQSGFLAIVMLLLSAAWAPAEVKIAKVKITNVSISPRLLVEFYQAHQNQRNSIPMAASHIFMMIATCIGKNEKGVPLEFKVEIMEGRNQVVVATGFQARPLEEGTNRYNANQINTSNINITFNDAYQPGSVSQGARGSIFPMGNYRVAITPTSPAGSPYIVNFAFFAPQSSLNIPPRPVYPRNVEVNTLLPNFSWTPVQKAKEYEVMVSPNKNPEVNTYWRSRRLRNTQTLYSSAARTLESGQKYYWKVRAFDDFGKPIGGKDGCSQPAWFQINTIMTRVSNKVSPAEADSVLKSLIPDKAIVDQLKGFRAIALETNCDDLAGLLRQLREGTAKLISARLE